VSVPSRLHRPLAAAVLAAALLAPLQPALSAFASPSTSHTAHPAHAKVAVRATQATLTAYGDSDGSGTVHLSGSLRWANGKALGRAQHVELWGRTGTRWALVSKAVTDRHGDVELSVTPVAHTTYQLRYAGSRSATLSSPAGPSTSRSITVHAVAQITLKAPAKVRRGQTFVITGTVTPAGAGRRVTLSGNRRTFTTLTTRADGSFSGHVRLQMTTTLSVQLPDTATLDGAISGPRVVRVG
jgi:hypothetical protein